MTTLKKKIILAINIALVTLFLGGIGYVGFGVYMEYPPSSLTSTAIYIIGILTVITSLFGFCTSVEQNCCSRSYYIFYIILFIFQVVFILCLFLKFDKICDDLHVKNAFEKDLVLISKWLFLVIILDGIFVLILFELLKWHINDIRKFETLKEPNENISLDLKKLKIEVEKKGINNNFDIENTDQKLRKKMAKKYGHLSHTVDWGQQKHNKKWWKFYN